MVSEYFLKINSKSVAVKKSGSGDKTLVFIHGSSMSSETWIQQLANEELNKQYQLIAFDLPGHGNSEWLNGSDAYSLQGMTGVVKAILQELSITNFIFAGMSYGTNILGEISPPLQGCKGIMLISPCIISESCPPSEVIIPNPYAHLIVAEDPPENELREYIQWGIANEETGNKYYNSYRNTDPAFRKSIGRTMINGEFTDELANISGWNIPVCVVFGEDENLINTNYLDSYPPLWERKTFKVKNAGHMVQEENASELNRLLLSFASAVFK